jgi:serine/threonine protein phosphatase 1
MGRSYPGGGARGKRSRSLEPAVRHEFFPEMSDLLTYAIGDIHGCSDLLVQLLRDIRDHAAGRPYRLVFLGDYIDRGPDSAAVINTLVELQEESPETVTCLMGSHEYVLIMAAANLNKDGHWARVWYENGGLATAQSYGKVRPQEVPPDVLFWVTNLPTIFEDERRIYVHAGLDPRIPLAAQTVEVKLWIRDPFLTEDHDFGKHVVHGHTPTKVPDVRRHRTNLNTGAGYGGMLTAGIFTDEQDAPVGFLHAPSSVALENHGATQSFLTLLSWKIATAPKEPIAERTTAMGAKSKKRDRKHKHRGASQTHRVGKTYQRNRRVREGLARLERPKMNAAPRSRAQRSSLRASRHRAGVIMERLCRPASQAPGRPRPGRRLAHRHSCT